MVIGNPVESQYDRMVKKYNGRIVGIKRNEVMINGNLYDLKLYEILKEEFEEVINGDANGST